MKKPININYICNYELSRGTEYSAGIDLYIPQEITIKTGETVKIDSSFAVELPEGYYGMLVPRSSFGLKGLYMHIGIIDQDYRGNISFVISNYSNKSWFKNNSIKLEKHEKIGQLIIQPYLNNIKLNKTDSLSQTTRGKGGFGSTGK